VSGLIVERDVLFQQFSVSAELGGNGAALARRGTVTLSFRCTLILFFLLVCLGALALGSAQGVSLVGLVFIAACGKRSIELEVKECQTVTVSCIRRPPPSPSCYNEPMQAHGTMAGMHDLRKGEHEGET
jgi:hypothetical protein